MIYAGIQKYKREFDPTMRIPEEYYSDIIKQKKRGSLPRFFCLQLKVYGDN